MVKMRWVDEARRHIGLTEIKGPQHNPEIVAMWKAIKRGGIRDDETPWCAAFVGACLERVGIQSTRFEGARSYASWGEKLEKPVAGCVVVFSRDGGGHVGFVVGQDKAGNLLVPIGVLSFPVVISTASDLLDENNEAYTLTVGGVPSVCSITDDDATPVELLPESDMPT